MAGSSKQRSALYRRLDRRSRRDTKRAERAQAGPETPEQRSERLGAIRGKPRPDLGE